MFNNPKSHLCRLLLKNTWIFLILMFATDVSSHKCYKCGPASEQFKQTCDLFNFNPELFIEECPNEHKGCILSNNSEGVLIRECQRGRSPNSCQSANNIKYCFCSEELCNGISIEYHQPTDDDEATIDEGSGSIKQNTVNDVILTVQVNSSSTILYGPTTLLAITIFFN